VLSQLSYSPVGLGRYRAGPGVVKAGAAIGLFSRGVPRRVALAFRGNPPMAPLLLSRQDSRNPGSIPPTSTAGVTSAGLNGHRPVSELAHAIQAGRPSVAGRAHPDTDRAGWRSRRVRLAGEARVLTPTLREVRLDKPDHDRTLKERPESPGVDERGCSGGPGGRRARPNDPDECPTGRRRSSSPGR
jgi:hypothetical protein